jgi:YYY domain-containing protein
VIFEWFAREGWIVLSWWALVTLAGIAVFPMVTRLLGGLSDRGYTLARAIGLLVVGFVFWLLASLGLLRNSPGSIILLWLIVLIVSLIIYVRQPLDWRAWWHENRSVVIVGEILFFVLLLGWALFRAHLPNLTGTEKPMELMFMSSVQRSEMFPPNDGWMSGYAISYYYFGYVMSAMLSMMSGITSTTGFNMTISLLVALTGLTTFGVVYNLVRSRAAKTEYQSPHLPALAIGLLGMVFVTLMGNFQAAFIELPYQTRTASNEYMNFWGIDSRDEAKPPLAPGDAIAPENWDFWWWFRASRILTDTDLSGQQIPIQPIDEFPQFSFLLADVHPHVLALPFAMLALGLALNLLLMGRSPVRGEVIFYGLCLGGLVFLNTWDGPIYMVVLVGADALRRLMRNGTGRLLLSDWWGLLGLGISLLLLTLVFYFPFFISFRSQASGVLPNLLHPTLFRQYFIMFGPFVLLLGAFLALELWCAGKRMNWRLGLGAAGALLGLLLLQVLLFVILGSLVPELRGVVLSFVDQNGGWGAVLPMLLSRRVTYALTSIVLLGAVVVVIGRLFPRIPTIEELRDSSKEDRQIIVYPPATGFALLLVGVGAVLTLIPEFIYLRDNFGVRINTIFKFYYQAWLAFSVAGAYAVYTMLADAELRLPRFRGALTALVTVAILLGMIYPFLGIHNRMFIESARLSFNAATPLTLDGGLTTISLNDYDSIMCLNQQVQGSDSVVLEAADPGSAYNITGKWGRVAMLSGIPIILGWQNHEGQWRGPTFNEILGSRPQDVDRMYSDLRWDVVQPLLDQYGIDYVFYGETERNKYGSEGEEKFADNLEVMCDAGGSRFYRVAPTTVTVQQ